MFFFKQYEELFEHLFIQIKTRKTKNNDRNFIFTFLCQINI